MVKHTQTIRRQQPTKCLSVFDDFEGLALKGLIFAACKGNRAELMHQKRPND